MMFTMETELFHFAGKESFLLRGSNQAQNLPITPCTATILLFHRNCSRCHQVVEPVQSGFRLESSVLNRPASDWSGRSEGELFPFYARKKSGLFLWAAFRKRGCKNPQDLLSKFKAESLSIHSILSIHRNCLESSSLLRKKQIFLNQ